MDQVEVDVEDDGDLRFPADGGDGLQDLRRRGAGFQAALGGELVDQAIGQRIAERHAQFQHIHAELVERQRQLARGFEVRIARADVNDEALLALAVQPGESFHNAIHASRRMPQAAWRFNGFNRRHRVGADASVAPAIPGAAPPTSAAGPRP